MEKSAGQPPRVPRTDLFVRIPTLDALVYVSSQLAPMRSYGIMSTYGGLVPLGFPHSNLTNDLCSICLACAFFTILSHLPKNRNPIFRLTNIDLGAILLASEYPFECLQMREQPCRRIENRVRITNGTATVCVEGLRLTKVGHWGFPEKAAWVC